MTSPRKFAEKIALLNQKEAEGTAEFEQIMRDVQATKADTRKSIGICQTDTLQPSCGSTPNVANVGVQATSAVLAKTSGQAAPSPSVSPSLSPNDELCAPSGGGGGGGGGGGRGRSTGVGPMRSRPVDKRADASPYGTPMGTPAGTPVCSSPYLTPPTDGTWRRTHSDSALHQSSTADHLLTPLGPLVGHLGGNLMGGPLNPATARRVDNQNHHHGGSVHVMDQRNRRHLSASPDGRPRSSTTSQPRSSSNNMYQLQQEMQQIPTGSLPDLTSLHFPPPLHTPLDQDDSNSPYGTSPRTSSTMLSPGPQLTNIDRFTYSPHTSRGPSPEPGAVQSPHSPHSLHSPSPHSPLMPLSPNSLSVPGHFRYLHAGKGVSHDNGSELHSQQRSECHQQNQYSYVSPEDLISPHMSASSPISIINSHLQQSEHDFNSLSSYRNPQSISRPSPQSSPSLSAQLHRSSSPHSAPPSPISLGNSPSYMPENSYYSQAQAALQQGLEQFSMQGLSDEPLSQVHELTPDPGYFSTSPAQLHYSQNHLNNMCDSRTTQQPQTPNTPTSIPDIILTDADDLAKELGSAINVGSLDLDDVFPSDTLSRLDAEALDMLTSSGMDMVTDPATEAHFRMENENM